MALAKKDYDAQWAEEAFTRLRKSWQNGMPPDSGDATASLVAVQAASSVAQAHALEQIAAELAGVREQLDALRSDWEHDRSHGKGKGK